MNMKKPSITAVIIAKNEEHMLPTCLLSLKWCDEILVIDNNSSDNTALLAENSGAKVIHFSHSSFSRLRNEALKHLKTDWVFYVDADERVLPVLAKEIKVQMETNQYDVFSLKRKNICYGKELKHGGWEKDLVTRVFKVSNLKRWDGDVHESPIFEGQETVLNTELIHHTHRNTTDGLNKTIKWTKMEAKLLADSGLQDISFLTIFRKGLMEFLRRGISQKGYKDGLPGLIEALTQGINKMLVYIQVWEFQQNPSLKEQYQKRDVKITKIWKKDKFK